MSRIHLFWVVLGSAVFFVAMRGGPRGARESLHTESKASQRAVTLGVVLAFAFGLIVPALVLAHNAEHKAERGGRRRAPERRRGEGPRTVLPHLHGLPHAGRGQVGRPDRPEPRRAGRRGHPDRGRTQGARAENAIAEGRARGLGQMPAMLYQGKEAEEVAAFVAAVAGH